LYSGLRDRTELGCMWEMPRCQRQDDDIVRAIRVDLDFLAAIGQCGDISLSAFRIDITGVLGGESSASDAGVVGNTLMGTVVIMLLVHIL